MWTVGIETTRNLTDYAQKSPGTPAQDPSLETHPGPSLN